MATIAINLPVYRELTPGQRVLQRLRRRHGAMLGLAVVIGFIALALFAPWISPYDPLQTSWSAVRKAPSAAHWFGTDEIGRRAGTRDLGTRASLLAGWSRCASLTLGVPIGLLAGYLGGWVDALISRITGAMLACPFLILAIAPRAGRVTNADRVDSAPRRCSSG
jgi:peptide/nickel transport system permease protein